MYRNVHLHACRYCSCSLSHDTELSTRGTGFSVLTRSTQTSPKYRYEDCEVEECWCSDPRCSFRREFPVSYSQRSRKSEETRSSSKQSSNKQRRSSRKMHSSRYYGIPNLPLESADDNYVDGVEYELSQSESSVSPVSRYTTDDAKSSDTVKSTGKCRCKCSKPERLPKTISSRSAEEIKPERLPKTISLKSAEEIKPERLPKTISLKSAEEIKPEGLPKIISLRSAEEIKKAVRSQIAVLEKLEANGCDCYICKPPPPSKKTMCESSSESKKSKPSQSGHHANDTANDLVRTEIIDPMIRRLQRVYLNNKIHELGILDSLYDMRAQINEVYRNRNN
ncbi:uncharacterized protein LOC120455864 [Drosophila santomea]|uniref:uncharacterized protein LOC120455864 n=1 Tax=Drosophila santomea TaxID=129105 RepID=UPI0019547B4D|nr:uncharacterized protein LOC120455864 [Drosophila santomea]